MSNIFKVRANKQAYLTAICDQAQDKFDVLALELDYGITAADLPDQIIEMLGSEVGGGYDTVDAPCEESTVWFDPTKYDGDCTFFFEVVGYCYNNDDEYLPNGSLPVYLVDGSTVYATIDMEDNSDDVWNEEKYWWDYYFYQVEFTPPTEACFLRVQLPTGYSWGDEAVTLQAARIRVRQTGATKTRTMIPMMQGWGTGFDDPESSYWNYDSNEIGDIKKAYLEANAEAWPNGTFWLYDLTASEVVSGSTGNASSYGTVTRVEIPVGNLVSGHTYKVDWSGCNLCAANLALELDPCTKFAAWYRVGLQSDVEYWYGGRDEAEDWTGYNLYVDPGCRQLLRLPANAKAYFECTGKVGPATGNNGVGLRDAGSNTHDWYGTTLSAHALEFTGSGYELKRTDEITDHLVDGRHYVVWWGGAWPPQSGNYACVLPCGSFIVLTAPGA